MNQPQADVYVLLGVTQNYLVEPSFVMPTVLCEHCGAEPGNYYHHARVENPSVLALATPIRTFQRSRKIPQISWADFSRLKEAIAPGSLLFGELRPRSGIGNSTIAINPGATTKFHDLEAGGPGDIFLARELAIRLREQGLLFNSLPIELKATRSSNARPYEWLQPECLRVFRVGMFAEGGRGICSVCGGIYIADPRARYPDIFGLNAQFKQCAGDVFVAVGMEHLLCISARLHEALVRLKVSGMKSRVMGKWV